MNITAVQTKHDLNKFIELPYQVYSDDPNWVPPLRSEVRGQFDAKRNPLLDHCEYSMFLLWDNEQVIGRIAAFIDRLAVDYWQEAVGLFGYYECPPNKEASMLLLETARKWLSARGMTAMVRGAVLPEWGRRRWIFAAAGGDGAHNPDTQLYCRHWIQQGWRPGGA